MMPISMNSRIENLPPRQRVAERHTTGFPKEAFTLIEMLVVIAIVAVLAAIALPAISSMRESGNNGKCVANLKALHAIATTYASDYGFYPPVYDTVKPLTYPASNQDAPGFPTFPYIAYSNPCSVCPSAEHNGKNDRLAPQLAYQSGYAANPKVMPFNNSGYVRVRPHMIQRPSQVILLGDTSQYERLSGVWIAYGALINPFPINSQIGSDTASETAIQTGPYGRDVVFEPIPESNGDGPSIRLRHNGRANLIFVDGHVESITNVSQLKQKNFYWNY